METSICIGRNNTVLKDRILGAYIGAAIGDAMGGPLECSHASRIKRTAGQISAFLPYNGEYSLIKAPAPGYALQTTPGAVTDDTFIRADITRYYTSTSEPRSVASLAEWLINNAGFDMWWQPAEDALKRVERGEVSASTGGMTNQPGGGVGWWTPVGILYAGNPGSAFEEAKRMCSIWKDPLESDLLASVQAGVAAAFIDGATCDTVVDALLRHCGSLARKFLERGIEIGRQATSQDDLIEQLYAAVLVSEQPRWNAAKLPPSVSAPADTDKICTSVLLCEQVPLATAAFVFADGDPAKGIPLTVMIGRDCDTTATTTGSWCGALHGESNLPEAWVETVCNTNLHTIDIRGLAQSLYKHLQF